MLRFAFRSPYEHRIAPLHEEEEAVEEEGGANSCKKKLRNATLFR